VFIPYCLLLAAAAILLIVIVRAITRGPVGREPVAAQRNLAPQDGVAGPGLAYPQVPADDGGGRLAAGAGYALSALAVVVAAALAAAAIYGQSIRTSSAAPRTPAPTAGRTSAAAHTPASQELTTEQLRPGDCLQGPPDINSSKVWPDVVRAVPCSKWHLAEVFYSANYWPEAMAFPGNTVMNRQGRKECLKSFRAYDGISYSASQYNYEYLTPGGRQDWNSGDRQLLCAAYLWPDGQSPRGQKIFGSIKGAGQ
jgi:hypothetical protein